MISLFDSNIAHSQQSEPINIKHFRFLFSEVDRTVTVNFFQFLF